MLRILLTIIFIAISCVAFQQSAAAQISQCASGCGGSAVSGCGGPGTEMTKIINRIGLGSDCGRCKALANEMDQNGPQWVMNNFNYVSQRTISNAENLGHRMGPVRRVGVRQIVRASVRRSR